MWVPGRALFLGGLWLKSQERRLDGPSLSGTCSSLFGELLISTLQRLVLENMQSPGFVKSDPNPQVNKVTHIGA